MNDCALLTHDQVQRLLSGKPISAQLPWATDDEGLVDRFLCEVCDDVTASTGSHSQVEWGHYGSGYASFVDAWFYKATPDFAVRKPVGHGQEHAGLVVLLSRLSPYVVFMEGERRWHDRGSSSYLPAFDGVDDLQTPGVALLARQVQPILERHGLVRVPKNRLAAPIDPGLSVPTILADGPFTQFDALFHWED